MAAITIKSTDQYLTGPIIGYLYVICTLFIRMCHNSSHLTGESSSFAIVVECDADSTSMMPIILPDDLLAFQ